MFLIKKIEENWVIATETKREKSVLAFFNEFAKSKGSAIANLTFHERANALKQVAQYLLERKENYYELAKATGCTRKDAWIDVEGGIGTLFAYSSLVRRELSDETALVEDAWIPLSKNGTFGAKHILSPKAGVAVHIDAFNFPIWGMLVWHVSEKLSITAPTRQRSA